MFAKLKTQRTGANGHYGNSDLSTEICPWGQTPWKPEDFAQDGTIFQIGVAPCRIDVINKIDGVSYADASPRAIPKTIEGVPVRIISREDLIANKRASGRTKDLADAEILEGLGK